METIELAALVPGSAAALTVALPEESTDAVAQRVSIRSCVAGVDETGDGDDLVMYRHEGTTDTFIAAHESARWHLHLAPVPDYGWWQRPAPVTHAGMLLTLFALRFPAAAARDGFIDATRAHGRYCLDHEPGTLVYGLGRVTDCSNASAPCMVDDLMVVMVSADRAAIDQHANDPRHVALGAEVAALGIPVQNTFAKTVCLGAPGYLWRS